METKQYTPNNLLRQALARRESASLPSNFSYRLMQRVSAEAEQQRKRQARWAWAALLIVCVGSLGVVGYFLFFKWQMKLDLSSLYTSVDNTNPEQWQFYSSIAVIALILLGIDSWLRSYRKKWTH